MNTVICSCNYWAARDEAVTWRWLWRFTVLLFFVDHSFDGGGSCGSSTYYRETSPHNETMNAAKRARRRRRRVFIHTRARKISCRAQPTLTLSNWRSETISPFGSRYTSKSFSFSSSAGVWRCDAVLQLKLSPPFFIFNFLPSTQCDQKKLPNVYKGCPKIISQEKW